MAKTSRKKRKASNLKAIRSGPAASESSSSPSPPTSSRAASTAGRRKRRPEVTPKRPSARRADSDRPSPVPIERSKKKKIGLTPFILLGGALAIAGFFAYSQVAGKNKEEPFVPAVPPAPTSTIVDVTVPKLPDPALTRPEPERPPIEPIEDFEPAADPAATAAEPAEPVPPPAAPKPAPPKPAPPPAAPPKPAPPPAAPPKPTPPPAAPPPAPQPAGASDDVYD